MLEALGLVPLKTPFDWFAWLILVSGVGAHRPMAATMFMLKTVHLNDASRKEET
jgi:hypothetical protein